MPELPEVETIARGLAKRITGDVIESLWLGQKPEPLKSPAAEMAAVLEHSRISTVRRMGKHIVFDLDRVGRTLLSARSVSTKKSAYRTKPRRTPTAQLVPASFVASGRTDKSVRPTPAAPSKAQWIVHLGLTSTLQG